MSLLLRRPWMMSLLLMSPFLLSLLQLSLSPPTPSQPNPRRQGQKQKRSHRFS